MPVVKTKVFRRSTVPTEPALGNSIAAVTAEVNAHLAALPNLGDVLDVRYELTSIEKYGSSLHYMATVIYVE